MSPKFFVAMLLSLFLSALSFGAALADDYEIPVIAGGKVFTISISVEDHAVVSATTKTKGVSVGKPVEVIHQTTEDGQWASLLPNALETVQIDKDDFSGSTFYTNKAVVSALGSKVYAYVGAKGDKRWLCLAAIMVTDKLLIFDRATVLADGEKFTLQFDLTTGTHEYLGDSSYFDAADVVLESSDNAMVEAMASAKTTKIRFYTRNSTYDYVLSERDKKAITEALAVYELLGGKLSE